ncbi:WD repeat-containing protein GTS1 isoform X1 [Prosopis cineraria]|uniref:WD repeat-containing protein GTS1 isoform X1 n=1 Tax=Prosopis cineraria TaxID=364024 RepID=UPI0024108646|nr:WD repeat-containing protein GTS1 isoform X1 [Prosopis cineraria]XP_054803965.1 WD repeat-containing protein GTS1 isoform X1 [Prosopis cineraria]XP_054803966.1 WD repeat-containing protein GTS1 isoform X1 [Prosopis cineraria]
MEATTTMDVEAQPLLNLNPAKRFRLKNSIQTNFGDDYVFQIVPKDDWSTMAVSLSTNTVKLYSPVAGHYHGECKGHSDTINQILFSGLLNSHVLGSCSSDGTIRIWDTRTSQQVSCILAGSSQEVFSFSVGGPGGNLIAAGCKSQIIFWDWRNHKQIACLEDSHVDDVTQVHFVPNQQGKLVSASVDGLICTFDIAGDINDDDHLESVINVGTSISKVGFIGESWKLWCLTHIETLSIWDWKDARNEVNFTDARSLASEGWSLDNVDYFVDCHYSREAQQLWVIGGTNAGVLGYFPVSYNNGAATVGSAEAILQGGHTSVVRSVLPMSRVNGGPGCDQGIFGWTGGEDGRLCCWLSDDSPQVNRSWISSTLIMKSERTRKKNRHQPY